MQTPVIENEKKIEQLIHQLMEETERLTIVISELQKHSEQEVRLMLRDIQYIHIVLVEEIIYCKAERSYTRFFMKNGEAILISKNLKNYEKILEPLGFYRIHHSYLVNIKHIKRIDKQNNSKLILSNQDELPISKSKRELLFQKLSK